MEQEFQLKLSKGGMLKTYHRSEIRECNAVKVVEWVSNQESGERWKEALSWTWGS